MAGRPTRQLTIALMMEFMRAVSPNLPSCSLGTIACCNRILLPWWLLFLGRLRTKRRQIDSSLARAVDKSVENPVLVGDRHPLIADLNLLRAEVVVDAPQYRYRSLAFNTSNCSANLKAAIAAHGYQSIGHTEWAFNNRTVGWFVLLCYAMTGALIVNGCRTDFQLLIRTFVGTGLGIAALELVLLLVSTSFVALPQAFVYLPLAGFSNNRNAFAFIVVLTICGVFALSRRMQAPALGLFLAALWYAGSRACGGAALAVLCAALYLRMLRISTIGLGLTIGAAIVIGIAQMPVVTGWLRSAAAVNWAIALSPSTSDLARWDTILGGLAQFYGHPIFGAGLGTFIADRASAGTPIVIHSTPIWLLAEMGLVGLLAFLVPAVRIFWAEWRRPDNDDAGKLLVLLFVAFAVVSLLHDMLYQRAIWLLLGAALAFVPQPLRTDGAR